MLLNDYIINKSRSNLTRFVLDKASRLSRDLGFSYIETEQAPNSFEDLQEAYKLSAMTHCPLPIFLGASESTIYTSREGNWAFRFWHDVTHVSNGLGFSLAEEVECSSIQAEQVAKYFGTDSPEYRLFIADTIGQSVYAALHGGEFPKDQLSYVKTILRSY